jgi:hypothetical protein
MARLASRFLVSALVRRVNAEGGSAMILARGDAEAGGILVLAYERTENPRFFERGLGPDGRPALIASGPATLEDDVSVTNYWQRRRDRDPDLWVIELDVVSAERFAAETILGN